MIAWTKNPLGISGIEWVSECDIREYMRQKFNIKLQGTEPILSYSNSNGETLYNTRDLDEYAALHYDARGRRIPVGRNKLTPPSLPSFPAPLPHLSPDITTKLKTCWWL